MDPIKGAGTNAYAVTVPQNQVQGGYEDYSSMPMVYEPEMEEKKKASSNMLGMTALGILGIAGLGVGIYKHTKVKGLKNQINELTSKNEVLTKELDEAQAKIKDLTPKTWKEKFKALGEKLKPKNWFNKWGKGKKAPEVKPEVTPKTPTEPPKA